MNKIIRGTTMKIFVTGATGYVGRHLVKALLQAGHTVTALVRPSSNYSQVEQMGVKLCFGDVSDLASLEKAAQELYEYVIHLAFSLFPANDVNVNRDGIRNIIKVFQKRPLHRMIFVSSALVYGPTDQDAVIQEDVPCNPHMTFTRQQVDAEQAFLDAFKEDGMPVVILRPAEIFGGQGGFFQEAYLDGMLKGKVPMIGKGTNKVSMTYVGDLVQAIISALERDGIEGEIFNINIPDTVTTNELVEFIMKESGCRKPFRVPTPVAWIGASFVMLIANLLHIAPILYYDLVRVATMPGGLRDIRKAETMLGFTPRYQKILDGLAECYFH
jgi:nucleoside-diphosphate-sugar epimerase